MPEIEASNTINTLFLLLKTLEFQYCEFDFLVSFLDIKEGGFSTLI